MLLRRQECWRRRLVLRRHGPWRHRGGGARTPLCWRSPWRRSTDLRRPAASHNLNPFHTRELVVRLPIVEIGYESSRLVNIHQNCLLFIEMG